MQKAQEFKESILLFLRGLCMGIADVIPGVSGGTIAFITGVYNRLIRSLSTISFREWKKIDWSLFIPLGLGIGAAIFFLSGVMSYLLAELAGVTFAFFFGLIVASAFVLYNKIGAKNFERIVFLVLGLLVGYVLAGAATLVTNHSLLVIFISGFIAISAMLLPGISGAFLLLLLGQYEYVVNAIHDLDLLVVGIFGVGALCGLFGFSRVIDWLLRKARGIMLFFLVGLMVGSLRIPYGEIVASHQNWWILLVAGIVGFGVVFLLEGVFGKK